MILLKHFKHQSTGKKVWLLLQPIIAAAEIAVLVRYSTEILTRITTLLGNNLQIGCIGISLLFLMISVFAVSDILQKRYSPPVIDFMRLVGLSENQIKCIQFVRCLAVILPAAILSVYFLGFVIANLVVLATLAVCFVPVSFLLGTVLQSTGKSTACPKKTPGYHAAVFLLKKNMLTAYWARCLYCKQFLGFGVFLCALTLLLFLVHTPTVYILFVLAVFSVFPAYSLYEKEEKDAPFLILLQIKKKQVGTLIAAIHIILFGIGFLFVCLCGFILYHEPLYVYALSYCIGILFVAVSQANMLLFLAPMLPHKISAFYVSPFLLLYSALSILPLFNVFVLLALLRHRKKLTARIAGEE